MIIILIAMDYNKKITFTRQDNVPNNHQNWVSLGQRADKN